MIGFLHRTQTLTIRDDRGRRFPIRSPHLRLEMKADETMVLWYRLAQVRRDATSRVTTAVAWSLLGTVAVALIAIGVKMWVDGIPFSAAICFAISAGCLLGMIAWRRSLRRELAKLESARAALPPVCPSCRYDLAGLPTEPDGCTVCPECGAAWRFGTAKSAENT